MSSNGKRADNTGWSGQPPPIVCRGIRGAISVEANTRQAIVARTGELLRAIVAANGVRPEDIASVFFTATSDLDAEYPAVAARIELGWHEVALMCGQEMSVAGSLPRCIRVLIHWNTTWRGEDIVHVYLGDAIALRPDRQQKPAADQQNSSTTPLIQDTRFNEQPRK